MFGVKNNVASELQIQCRAFSQVVGCPVKILDPYGTHHTKMMLLRFEHGMRVVIHTANLVPGDWAQKTQGVWISPIFPLLKSDQETPLDVTNFKADLIAYLRCYKSSHLDKWIELIQKHDLSSAKVFLIGSAPGKYKGWTDKSRFGHPRLAKVLCGDYGPTEQSSNWPLICQFSSIGSIGSRLDNSWLRKELLQSLKDISKNSNRENPEVKCIFPTVENVRNSLEGYMAGASLPFSSNLATRQKDLVKEVFHQWKASLSGRTEASPHIKTYCRMSPDNISMSWFLLTSANLSKAAWGELQLNQTQLSIRSFELGVLFLPRLLVCSSFLHSIAI